MKINIDSSRTILTRSTSVSYEMRVNHDKIMIAKGKPIGDGPVLVTECLAIHEVLFW